MPVKHSLLALLAQEPATASQLQAKFAATMDNLWPLNPGQVAQTLHRLERDGLIVSSGSTTAATGRKAELYTTTEKGQEELSSWFGGVLAKPNFDRDELVVKFTLAASRKDIDLITLVDNQRFSTLRAVRELTNELRDLPQVRSAHRLALERSIFNLEGQLRWLDRVEALSPAQPAQEG